MLSTSDIIYIAISVVVAFAAIARGSMTSLFIYLAIDLIGALAFQSDPHALALYLWVAAGDFACLILVFAGKRSYS